MSVPSSMGLSCGDGDFVSAFSLVFFAYCSTTEWVGGLGVVGSVCLSASQYGFSFPFEQDKRESEVTAVDDGRETGQNCGGVEEHRHSIELDVEFWPVEHPLEPQDEDRPVKCPIPTSSLIDDGRRMREESLRKRGELPAVVNNEGIVVVAAAESRVGAVRKRHHTLTHGDRPSARMPPLRSQNVTIFQMLQQFDKFDY